MSKLREYFRRAVWQDVQVDVLASITKRNKSLFKVMAPAFEETAFTCWLHGIKAGTQLTPELIAAIAEELK